MTTGRPMRLGDILGTKDDLLRPIMGEVEEDEEYLEEDQGDSEDGEGDEDYRDED